MTTRRTLSTTLFVYLLVCAAIYLAIFFGPAYSSEMAPETGLMFLNQYGLQMLILFLMGAAALIELDIFHRADERVQWGVVLVTSGVLLLSVVAAGPLLALYIQALSTDAWFTLGMTTVFLGALLLVMKPLRTVLGMFIAHIKRGGGR